MIVFNGEIYNYIELKKQLMKKGAYFSTNTDTEVVVEAYRYWGINCTKYFNGMWAFAVYDLRNKQIFISRDRFGIKPLYIYESEDEFIFASEIKSILAVKPELRAVDILQVLRYLNGIPEDMDQHTFYKEIHNFPKCQNLLYDVNSKKYKYYKYWEVDIQKFKKKWKCINYPKRFLQLLEDAIQIRLRADVEVGASLSGGLDSSTIVGIISEKFKKKVHTFSAIYEDESCNEKEFIDCMNECCSTIPHYIYPDLSDNLIEDMKELIYYHDGPCHSASPYSGYCVYKGVKKQVKVLLDGQGADELFGGYLFFFNAKLDSLLAQKGWISKVKAMSLFFSIKNVWPHLISSMNNELLLKVLGAEGYTKHIKKKGYKCNAYQQSSGIKFSEKIKNISLTGTLKAPNLINNEFDKALYMQFEYKSLPRILHDVDRNSMAYSLEVRLPFLDYRLVEFSFALSDRWKIKRNWTKYIIRKSCKKYLPKKIYSRRNKMGFPAPFDKWLVDNRYRSEIKKYLDAFKERNIVDNDSLDVCYKEHLTGERNWANPLFRMMMLEIWLQNEIDTSNLKWSM